MIPYIQIPSLFGLIHAFGVLVATGILLGAHVVRMRARQIGIDDTQSASVSTWVVFVGIIVAHVFDVLAYQPNALAERWRLVTEGDVAGGLWRLLVLLVNPTAGLSSFGGFLGAFGAMIVWTRRNRIPVLPIADSLLFGLAPGWVFGRIGCFTAHDHPGRPSNFFLAVQYPEGPRHDLGLYEALFTIALTGLFFLLYRRPRRIGTYVTLGCLLYAPVRFCLDFLRVVDVEGADPRYFGLTPAQYGSILLFIAGLLLAWRTRSQPTTLAQPISAPDAATPSPPSNVKKRHKQSARG